MKMEILSLLSHPVLPVFYGRIFPNYIWRILCEISDFKATLTLLTLLTFSEDGNAVYSLLVHVGILHTPDSGLVPALL